MHKFFNIFFLLLICSEVLAQEVPNPISGDTTVTQISDSAEIALLDSVSMASFDGTVYSVNYFDFIDSLVENLPEGQVFPDWNHSFVHWKKYEFSSVRDTQIIVLVDTNTDGCGYVHPVPAIPGWGFGPRWGRYHYGMDQSLNTGDSVRCAFDGVVRVSQYNKGGYGNIVIVRHDNGLETYYGHLSKRLVEIDSLVHAGDIVGLGGSTGRSNGPHLHFEVRYFMEPFDPESIIDYQNQCLKSDTLYLNKEHFKYKQVVQKLADRKYYYVKSGDTLYGIALKNYTTVSALCKLNGIKSSKILQIGMRLRIR